MPRIEFCAGCCARLDPSTGEPEEGHGIGCPEAKDGPSCEMCGEDIPEGTGVLCGTCRKAELAGATGD